MSDSVRLTRLPNGLTVVTETMLRVETASIGAYVGAGTRNELPAENGVSHFLEHMAFRATRHFPDTEVVSRIYAAGGEWHGYTWIDQTTYFATVPREELDLLLRIEAEQRRVFA